MGKQDIVDRILSDATAEAEDVLAAARESAAKILAETENRAAEEMQSLQTAVAAKAKGISDGLAATARLDGAKILLAEKRKVIDGIYARAARQLAAMSSKDCLAFADKLLREFAEEGDEIVFAEGYPCAEEVTKLQIFREKKLTVGFGKAAIDGGFLLRGIKSDKDLSYGALLAADRAEHEAEIAAEIFK